MTLRSEIEEVVKKVENERENLDFILKKFSFYKYLAIGAVVSFTYVGIRSYLGFDMDMTQIIPAQPKSLSQAIDSTLILSGPILTALSALSYAGNSIDYLISKKNIRKLESRVEELTVDYNFSRGYD